ncbi:unnamed protein product [Caenorhabditis brenneri]
MAGPPKFYDLALETVVNCYKTDLLQTNVIPADSILSDQIFEAVMRSRDYCYDDHAKALIKEFKPTKLELNFGYIEEGTFDEIRKLKLAELRILNCGLISKYRVANTKQAGSTESWRCNFCICRFLDDILSPETKQGLRVLTISRSGSFVDNWMEELSLMLPNLEHLNIESKTMSVTDFTSLCNNMPNLHSLNISKTGIKSLNGLAKLQSLEYLNISHLSFETKEDIKDLFELKKLKKLVFGNNSPTWNHDWQFEKPFPKVETLECYWLKADDAFLRRILSQLPNLRTVVAYQTRITQAAAHPRISLWTGESVEAMMKTIGYYRSQNVWGKVDELFNRFDDYHTKWTGTRVDITPELITLMVDELEAVIRDFKLAKRILPFNIEIVLTKLPKITYKNHRKLQRRQSVLSGNGVNHSRRWKCQLAEDLRGDSEYTDRSNGSLFGVL